MERRLKGCQTVILQHVEEGLSRRLRGCNTTRPEQRRRTVLPALSSPRKRILAFLCRRPEQSGVSEASLGKSLQHEAHQAARGHPRTS